MWLRTGGKWLLFAIVSMISLPYLCTRKGKIIGYKVALHVHLNMHPLRERIILFART